MDLQTAASVLGDLYADLRKHLPIDNSLAGDMYGWKPPLLDTPVYSEIRSLNDRGLHQDAFEKWCKFATGLYNRERLEALCQCLRKAGAGARAKLIQVAKMIERKLKEYEASSVKPSSSSRKRSTGPSLSGSAKRKGTNTGYNQEETLVSEPSDLEADSDSHQSLEDSPQSPVDNKQTSSMSERRRRSSCTSRAKRRKISLSDITALKIVEKVRKEWLIDKMEAFLTDHRAVLLEGRHLINPTCKESIRAKLKLGDRSGAVTEVVEYFENNLDANKMEEFCVFLIDQAGETAPLLKQLAQKIRSCIDDLSGGPAASDGDDTPSSSKTQSGKKRAYTSGNKSSSSKVSRSNTRRTSNSSNENFTGEAFTSGCTSKSAKIIESNLVFMPYLEKLIPDLLPLGTVLDVENYAKAVLNEVGDPSTKCLKILSQWTSQTPNPTMKLFCEKLKGAKQFINLASTIAAGDTD